MELGKKMEKSPHPRDDKIDHPMDAPRRLTIHPTQGGKPSASLSCQSQQGRPLVAPWRFAGTLNSLTELSDSLKNMLRGPDFMTKFIYPGS